ncbi:MAG: hypothetical protein ACE5KZ_12550 [Candidatus Scalinduaceae bacterium]
MEIGKFFQRFFNSNIPVGKANKKHVKSFQEILHEEQAQLMRLISKAQADGTIEQFYQKYNPGITDRLFSV